MNAKTNAQGKDRKNLVTAIAKITGQAAKYNGAPGFTYTVGAYTVERDGSITAEDEAGINTLAAELKNRGFEIEMPETKTAESEQEATEEMTMDFTGTHEQVEAPINIPLPALSSAILYSIKALVGPSLPTNAGVFRPITIIAPEGCIVNPKEPGPVSVLIDAAQRIPDTIFGALSGVMSERILASSNGACTTCMIFGRTEKSGGNYFICHEAIAGGSGASHQFDGLSGVQVYLTNTSNMPIEATEIEYPDILVEKYYLRKDSGGPGLFRGGCGIERQYKMCSEGMAVNCLGDRQKFAPWGLDGGMDGAPGAFYLIDGVTGERKKLSHKTSNLSVKAGDSVLVYTPGAGGVGDPKKRDPEKVLKDVNGQLVSPESAERDYGVKVVPDGSGLYRLA